MFTIRQHPQHLRILVLTQTYGAQGIISRIPAPLRVHQLGVGVDHRLVQPKGHVLPRNAVVFLVVLRHEDYARKVHTVVVGVGITVPRFRIEAAAAATGGDRAAADVGSEKDGGEEDEEAKGDSDGVAKTDGGEVGGDGIRLIGGG